MEWKTLSGSAWDGDPVFVCWDDSWRTSNPYSKYVPCVAYYNRRYRCWYDACDDSQIKDPVYWMEIPKVPNVD